jgi:hypothetical protein
MSRRSPRHPLFAVLLLAACSDPSAVDPLRAGPLRLVPIETSLPTGVAGEPLAAPYIVQVVDARGRPVPDLAVTWVPLDGAGSVAAEGSRTDAQGRVSARWTLGTRAGGQLLAVRATLAGESVTLGLVGATALAGAPVRVRLAGDTTPALAVGQTRTVRVSGQDRYGNEIPDVTPAVQWTSSDPQVVSVSSGGIVEARSAGRAVVRAVLGEEEVALGLRVDAMPGETYYFPEPIGSFDTNGSRLLVVSARDRSWEYASGAWNPTTPRPDSTDRITSLVVLAGGSALGASVHIPLAWHSPQPGEWHGQGVPLRFSSLTHGEGIVFGASTVNRNPGQVPELPTAAVYRRGPNGGWAGLGFWVPVGDSALILNSIAAVSGAELYVGGQVDPRTGPAGSRPLLARWRAGSWLQLALPAHLVGAPGARITRLEASPDGTAYAVLVPGDGGRPLLLRIDDGSFAPVEDPLTAAREAVLAFALGVAGELVVAGEHRVAWRSNGTWTQRTVPAGWRGGGSLRVDPEGGTWWQIRHHEGQHAILRIARPG